MPKFNWQNGTLVSKAKVEIDGKIYEVEPEQYSGQTPLSAENFIAMQDGLIDLLYPVGSYYETSNASFDPNTEWMGTWVLDSSGKMTISQDTKDNDFSTIGATGGSKTHTQTVEEMPSHTHTYPRTGTANNAGYNSIVGSANSGDGITSRATGGGEAMDIMNPYIVVKRWHRTA